MSEAGNIPQRYVWEFPGNPTNAQVSMINPPKGALVIDNTSGAWYRKTTGYGDNSGYVLQSVTDEFSNLATALPLNSSAVGTMATGTGNILGQDEFAVYCTTGTTASSRSGVFWQKSSGPCFPGIGHYHNISWNKTIRVSFKFGFPVTLASGCGVIGYFGADVASSPTVLSWVPSYSGFGFKLLSDGSLSIYTDNVDGAHTLTPTATTVNVAGNSSALVQEMIFTASNGSVQVSLNGANVGTFSGLPVVEQANNDCYPWMINLNQTTSATANDILIFTGAVNVR